MTEIDIFGNIIKKQETKPSLPVPDFTNLDPTEPIDVVIPWVNTTSKKWQKLYKKYKKEEADIATDKKNAFGDITFRDYEVLKYWFRGIENNCPWVNRVILILQDESHIPEWLDVKCPKLRIVYHNEYIPNELLPTFNSMEILCFVPLIEGLSTNYIVCNDDTYFLNPIAKGRFFSGNNLPILPTCGYFHGSSYVYGVGCEWGYNIDNAYEIEKKYANPQVKYKVMHLPMPHNKDDDLKVLKDNWDAIYNSFTVSHFRNRQNVNDSTLYVNIARRTDRYYTKKGSYDNCLFFTLKDTLNFKGLSNYDVVCLNDYDNLNFEDVKAKMISFFQSKFPDRCYFELGDNNV